MSLSPLARDPAGNTTSGTFQVVVNGAGPQVTALSSLIDSFNLQEGWENSLDARGQQVSNAIAAGDTTAACNDLKAFSNEVSAQTGKKLTTSQVQAAITQIKTVLGC